MDGRSFARKRWCGRLLSAVLIALAALASLSLSSPAYAADAPTRTIRYDGNREVVVPQHITRVASAWEAQNAVVAMLGYGPNIVATTRFARAMPAFRKLIPGIQNVPLATAGAGELNVEELLRLQPQVLFLSSPPAPVQAAQLQRAGIAIATFRANAVSALLARTLVTGEILGGDALVRARQYQAYFEANVARVRKALETVPPAQRVRLYHGVGTALSTSGRPSLNQDWMDLAGVRNVAEDWFGPAGHASASVSIEQILAADPDLIVTMRASDAQQIRRDPRWRTLRAVKNGRVFANPRGMFWWCRETTEVALQFLWLAKLAYPQQMQAIDMRAETRRFYATFYGYELSDAEIDAFLYPSVEDEATGS